MKRTERKLYVLGELSSICKELCSLEQEESFMSHDESVLFLGKNGIRDFISFQNLSVWLSFDKSSDLPRIEWLQFRRLIVIQSNSKRWSISIEICLISTSIKLNLRSLQRELTLR